MKTIYTMNYPFGISTLTEKLRSKLILDGIYFGGVAGLFATAFLVMFIKLTLFIPQTERQALIRFLEEL